MDDGGRAGRGRGRGMAPREEHRGDLRRPIATPQEITAATLQQASTMKAFSESRAQPLYTNETKSPQVMPGRPIQHQSDSNVQVQHALASHQAQSSHLTMTAAFHQHLVTQQHIANQQQLANQHQQLASQQQLPNQQQITSQQLPNQQQLANHQQLANQQQLANRQLASLATYASHQQLLQQHCSQGVQPHQPIPVGIPAGNISIVQQYLDPQKALEYEELKKKQFQLEQIQLASQNNIPEQQIFQFQRQQQKLQSQHASDLEIQQKLASLHLKNSDATYLQQSPQQHFVQQQHLELQKRHQQQQQQYLQQAHLNAISTLGEPSGRKALSADAAEFVPRFSASNGQHVEPASDASKLASGILPQQGSGHVSLIQIQPELACHPVVVQVDTAVVQLSSNPSKYDSIAPQLTRLLSWQIEEENLMREVVTVIFEQGVGVANFRFTGGKLCEHLVKNVAQQYNGLSFKSILLNRCQEEFEYRHEYLAVQFYDRLIGFTFFLAEILTRLLMPSGTPILKLKEALCEMLNLLLDVSTNESLKCVAQVLKMSGRYLQMGDTTDIDNVIGKLRDIAMTSIPPNIKNLLMSVVEFRAANWGCSADDSSDTKQNGDAGDKPSSGPAANGGLPVLGTVYYGPDGAIQRIEEDFPEDYPSDSDDSASRQSSQAKVAPPVHELDEDEGAAFEQFLLSMD